MRKRTDKNVVGDVILATGEVVNERVKRDRRYRYSHLLFTSDALKSPIGLLCSIVREMDSWNIVSMSARRKDDVATEMKITTNAYKCYFDKMIKDGMIIRTAHNQYMVNPYIFTKCMGEKICILQNRWDGYVRENYNASLKRKSAPSTKPVSNVISLKDAR